MSNDIVKYITTIAIICLCALSNVSADTTIRMLHVEINPAVTNVWKNIAHEYEQLHPEQHIRFEFTENEAFKQRLATLLQSKHRPDLFYSWGGGAFTERAEAGLLTDMSTVTKDLVANISQSSLDAFKYEGKQYGLPYVVTQVGFWYNKKLFKKANVDGNNIKNWKQFLDAVVKLKKAGIVPISVGGAEKWPMHFYWTLLSMRIGGEQTVVNARNKKGKGFTSNAFVQAGIELKRLADLTPFQPGFMAATNDNATALFGDYGAAMQLMGDWNQSVQASLSLSKLGVIDEDLGWFNFPIIKGGKGKLTDTLGGINGFSFSASASPESATWMKFFLNKVNQSKLAMHDLIIPVSKGAEKALTNSFMKIIATNIAESTWHQIYYDQAFGANVGGVINDISVGIVTGDITPLEAAEEVQEAWKYN